MTRIPVILDCDTGTDDAVAIMLACLHPNLELRGCTIVNGNCPVDCGTDNTLRVLDNIGHSDVPVYTGAHGPLLPAARDTSRARAIHGLTLPLPPATTSARQLHAARFLVEQFANFGSELTLVATAPLTNLALAMALDPQFSTNVQRLIIMGGGHSIGNITPAAEFNFWMDPHAAAAVLAAGFRNLTLVTLDATHTTLITYEDCDRLRACGTPAALAAELLIRRRIDAHEASEQMPLPGSAPVHDALCIAALVDPSLISTRHVHVAVETSGTLTLGRSVIDLRHIADQPANCHVALSADRTRFVDLLLRTLTGNA